MGKLSRNKGASFERFVADQFRAEGFELAKRGLGQARSASEVPDVQGVPGYWIECKHQRHVRIPAAYEQASKARTVAFLSDEANGESVPVVVSRDNRRPELATLSLSDFLAIASRLRDLEARNACLLGPVPSAGGKGAA